MSFLLPENNFKLKTVAEDIFFSPPPTAVTVVPPMSAQTVKVQNG